MEIGMFCEKSNLDPTPYKPVIFNGIPMAPQTTLGKVNWFELSKAAKNERKITLFDW